MLLASLESSSNNVLSCSLMMLSLWTRHWAMGGYMSRESVEEGDGEGKSGECSGCSG